MTTLQLTACVNSEDAFDGTFIRKEVEVTTAQLAAIRGGADFHESEFYVRLGPDDDLDRVLIEAINEVDLQRDVIKAFCYVSGDFDNATLSNRRERIDVAALLSRGWHVSAEARDELYCPANEMPRKKEARVPGTGNSPDDYDWND